MPVRAIQDSLARFIPHEVNILPGELKWHSESGKSFHEPSMRLKKLLTSATDADTGQSTTATTFSGFVRTPSPHKVPKEKSAFLGVQLQVHLLQVVQYFFPAFPANLMSFHIPYRHGGRLDLISTVGFHHILHQVL